MLLRESLEPAALEAAAARLRPANLAFAARYPGESAARQPVHTVYGGAQHFRHDAAAEHGREALRALGRYAPTPEEFARALGIPADGAAEALYARVVDKLEREPVEDFRVDFEDGYGVRPDAEEDAAALAVAEEMARGMEAGTLPAYVGLRLKALTEETRGRGVRTLDLFLTRLLDASGGRLPPGLLLTLPKVTIPEQAAFFADVLEMLEERRGLAEGTLRFELMVEVPQAVVGADGRTPLPAFLEAARGRLVGAHFGTYDYTSGVGITAAHQGMRHPACDFARHTMQVAFAGTGIRLSDGSTAVLPVPVHEAASPSEVQERENREAVHRAWRMHFDDVRHSLVHGFYQGWDLHPAQLPTRFAAVFGFFLAGRDAAARRLRGFLDTAAQAGDAFDDPHAGQALLNHFLRGIACGALDEAEVLEGTGLAAEELRGRSFAGILAGRRGG
ncbi:MAG: phosphoenolpyruvate kinase [Gemmatimonadota bacterium]